jgi:hypothetical protein
MEYTKKMIQLELFEQDETTILRHKFNALKESQDKIRKSLYARNGELQKKYDDLLQRMEILERYICTIQ